MDEKNIDETVNINSPKLKVVRTFESNYEKGKDTNLTYSIDMYNERKDSIAKNIVLKDISDISDIDKNSIKVTDENGKEIPKDKYTIEEKTDEKNNKIFEMKFKDIYLIDKETNKEEITKKQNISPSTTFKKINVKYNVKKKDGKEEQDIHTKTILNSNNNILDKDDNDKSRNCIKGNYKYIISRR